MAKDDEFTGKITEDIDDDRETTEDHFNEKMTKMKIKTIKKLTMGIIFGSIILLVTLTILIILVYLSFSNMDQIQHRIELHETEVDELELGMKEIIAGNRVDIESLVRMLELRQTVNKGKFEELADILRQHELDNFQLERKFVELAGNVTSAASSSVGVQPGNFLDRPLFVLGFSLLRAMFSFPVL